MEYEIKKLSELNDKQIEEGIEIFVDGFFYLLQYVLKDKRVLRNIFKDAFDYNLTFIYVENDVVLGIVGVGNYKKRPIEVKKEICQKSLGKFKGTIIYKRLAEIFHKPMVNSEKEGHIDIITSKENYRGRGIASKLLNYVFENFEYESYYLEVLSKNKVALSLYKKLGFKEIKRSKNIFLIFLGIGNLIGMKLNSEKNNKGGCI